jgi:hypothetical protein
MEKERMGKNHQLYSGMVITIMRCQKNHGKKGGDDQHINTPVKELQDIPNLDLIR